MKNCPFCGSQDIEVNNFHAECRSCGAKGPAATKTPGTIYEGAVTLWNTRHPALQSPELTEAEIQNSRLPEVIVAAQPALQEELSKPLDLHHPDPIFTSIDWPTLEAQTKEIKKWKEHCLDGILATLDLLQKRAEELGLTKGKE